MLAGYPFPIPKTGSEAMWNHLLRYNGLGYDGPRYENWNVDAAGVADARRRGRRVLGVADLRSEEDRDAINATDPYWYDQAASTSAPPAATARRC